MSQFTVACGTCSWAMMAPTWTAVTPSRHGGHIELVGLRKHVRRRRRPSTASTWTIEPGEFFSLLGPSGCGKTTTLRMIAGFEQPTAGQILLDGRDLVAIPPHRRPVNTVFQSYALFPHLEVEDNVAYGLRWRRDGRSTRPTGAGGSFEAIELVRLGGLERPPAGPAVGRPAAARRPRPGADPGAPRCCSSTSRSAPSTPGCARTSRSTSPRCSARSGSRSSTSPTTRRRR